MTINAHAGDVKQVYYKLWPNTPMAQKCGWDCGHVSWRYKSRSHTIFHVIIQDEQEDGRMHNSKAVTRSNVKTK